MARSGYLMQTTQNFWEDSFRMFYCKHFQGFPLFLMYWFQLIATLPDNVQPGPDFYGLPWQPVIVTAILGIVSFAIFSWRTILVVSKFSDLIT